MGLHIKMNCMFLYMARTICFLDLKYKNGMNQALQATDKWHCCLFQPHKTNDKLDTVSFSSETLGLKRSLHVDTLLKDSLGRKLLKKIGQT